MRAQFRADQINDPKSNYAKMAQIEQEQAEILAVRDLETEEEDHEGV